MASALGIRSFAPRCTNGLAFSKVSITRGAGHWQLKLPANASAKRCSLWCRSVMYTGRATGHCSANWAPIRPLQKVPCYARRIRTRTKSCSMSSSPKVSQGPASAARQSGTGLLGSVIPNTGSTARDHLANERTFLAWARTGLTFVALGVAIDSLSRMKSESVHFHAQDSETPEKLESQGRSKHLPAIGCVATGGSVLAFATLRYFRVQRVLLMGCFPINRWGVATVIMTTSALTAISLGMTFSDEDFDTSMWFPAALVPPIMVGEARHPQAVQVAPRDGKN